KARDHGAPLAACQRVQLLERLGFEEGPAGLLARAADLGADRAMPVVRSVLRALLGAARARADAGLQQALDEKRVVAQVPRQHTRGRSAHVRAIRAEADAAAHLLDV